MDLYFLSAYKTPLVKTFERDATDKIIKHSYPLVQRFTSHHEQVTDLKSFYDKLNAHAKQTHCLLKGTLTGPIENQSRAGKTQRDEPTEWICLDIDGIPGITHPKELFKEIPACQNTDYVLQYSASQGIIKDRGLSAHVFFMLHNEETPQRLKLWLMYLNLTVPCLRENIGLNRVGTALTWPLDVTTCQNDKLLYIAPPILKGRIKDPYQGKRIQLVRGSKNRRLTPNFDDIDAGWVERERKKLLNELRKREGYSAKRQETKTFKSVEVASKPDGVVITDVKEERGFVYLNLNGGDSWAYYHPITNPEIIDNFKGEPPLATKDLSPQYYEQAQKRAQDAKREIRETEQQQVVEQGTGSLVLGFRNHFDDQYYIGTFDAENQDLEVRPTSTTTKLNHFLVEQGELPQDVIPTWYYKFRFDIPTVIDPQTKFINKYVPTGYMGLPQYKGTSVPPTIKQVLQHVFNDTSEILEHYLNWLAFIYQYREKPETAWLVHGTEGTGKNLLFSRILAPIFGEPYCITVPLDALEDQFNQQFEEAVLVLISEADIEAVRNPKRVMERLRELITDSPLSIRPMRGTRYDAMNFSSVMMSSNQPASLEVNYNDRRINIATRQDEELRVDDAFLARIDEELAHFAAHLASIKVDKQAVRRPIETEARKQLQLISGNSISDVARAIKQGDLDFFLEMLPAPNAPAVDGTSSILADNYRKAVDEMCRHAVQGEEHRLARDQLHTVFSYCIDHVPNSPHKFTKFLRYHGLYTVRIRKDGELVYGLTTLWKPSNEVMNHLKSERKNERQKSSNRQRRTG